MDWMSEDDVEQTVPALLGQAAAGLAEKRRATKATKAAKASAAREGERVLGMSSLAGLLRQGVETWPFVLLLLCSCATHTCSNPPNLNSSLSLTDDCLVRRWPYLGYRRCWSHCLFSLSMLRTEGGSAVFFFAERTERTTASCIRP